MTIIYLYHSFFLYGGLERILIEKMNYLTEKLGYNVIMVTYCQFDNKIAYPISPQIKHYDLRIPIYHQYNYGIVKRIYFYIKMRKTFIKKMESIILKNNADILIGTTCEYFMMDVMNALRHRIITIIESHTNAKYIQIPHHNNFIKITFDNIQRKLINYFIKKASSFVTLTEGDKKEWLKVRKDILVIPNSIGNYPQKITHAQTYKRIITVGRLEEQKGYDLLLMAWKLVEVKHPEWELEIYGEGSKKGLLMSMISDYKLSSVKINKPTKNIYSEYENSDFYVMSSRYEGFPLVLIEAMSCGLPCISFNCDYGPSDIIKDGIDGFIIENANIKSLAKKICFLMENENLRIQMGTNAHNNMKRFLPENIMPRWEQLFNTFTNIKRK